MQVLIVEDEELSAKRAATLIIECEPKSVILGICESIEETVNWLSDNPAPDLILLDIHLSDGLSFTIFDQKSVSCPVIFTTAFDQYALQAFKINSIDYLLKPIDVNDLKKALLKYNNLTNNNLKPVNLEINKLRLSIESLSKKYKSRFLVKYGDTIFFKNVEEVAYFFASEKFVYLVGTDTRKYLIDYNLEELEQMLNSELFFRINRKIISNIQAISKVKTHINSRLEVFVKPNFEENIYISKEKSPEFKAWLNN